MDNQRRNHLVSLLFDRPFPVQVAPIYLDMAYPPPDIPEQIDYDATRTVGGCHITRENSNEKYVLEALSGTSRYTGDEDRDREFSITPTDHHLSVEQMAEIINVEGEFTFIDPGDVTSVSDILDEYIVGLEQGKRAQPHYKMPPKDDLDKLSKLNAVIQPLTSHIRNVGLGKGSWDEVMGLLISTKVEGRGAKMDRESKRWREEQALPKVSGHIPQEASGKDYLSNRSVKKDPFIF